MFVGVRFSFVGRFGSVGIATTLRAGRSGDRIQVGGDIFRTLPVQPEDPPSFLYNGYRVSLLEVKRPGSGLSWPAVG